MTKYTTDEIEEALTDLDTRHEVSCSITATIWHEPLNGGSGAHRISCSDGASYATKFPGTPHHDWILGREYAFTSLANAFDSNIAISVHAISMTSDFISAAPSTVAYAITGSTAVGTSWIENARDVKTANGAITVTSYSPELWASVMVFQTWAGAEDPAALATPTCLLSVDHAWYMQPTTLTGAGPARSVCAASLSASVVAAYARPAIPQAVDRLHAMSDETIISAFSGLPDAWWSYGRRERAEICTHLLDRRHDVADWIAGV